MEVIKNNKTKIKKINAFMNNLLNSEGTNKKRLIYKDYEEIINQIEAIDIFYLDMYKDNATYTIKDILESANKFVNVFHEPLERNMPKKYDSYLFEYFIKENEAIEKHLIGLKKYLKNKNLTDYKEKLIYGFEKCLEIERKFLKKENILYPKIEDLLPSTKPLKVLWTLHDEARTLLKLIIKELKNDKIDSMNLSILIGKYYFLIIGLNLKEALILLPVADKLINKKTKDEMYLECLEYGFVFIDNLPSIKIEEKETTYFKDGVIHTKTGYLSLEQLNLLLEYLPLDITFVDRFDKVVYFNNRTKRHFPRNPSIIGRKVYNCHPQKSVEIVKKIVNAFKAGYKDEVSFWVQNKDSFLYINYYAVRDKNGKYMGTLEVSQDITKINSLEGSKTLIDF